MTNEAKEALKRTTNVLFGVMGTKMVDDTANTMTPGLAKTITKQGTVPMLGLGTMRSAAEPLLKRKKK